METKEIYVAENIADKIYQSYDFGNLTADIKKCLALKLLFAIGNHSDTDSKDNMAWLNNLSGAWSDDGLSADEEAEAIRCARTNNATRLVEEL